MNTQYTSMLKYELICLLIWNCSHQSVHLIFKSVSFHVATIWTTQSINNINNYVNNDPNFYLFFIWFAHFIFLSRSFRDVMVFSVTSPEKHGQQKSEYHFIYELLLLFQKVYCINVTFLNWSTIKTELQMISHAYFNNHYLCWIAHYIF